MGEKKKKGSISYAKWGYIFIAPFFIIFAVFQLIPLASTIYYGSQQNQRGGRDTPPAPLLQFSVRSKTAYAGHTTSVSSGYFSLMAVSKFALAASSCTLPVK